MSDYGVNGTTNYNPDYIKDPDATLDFEFDWSAELDGDTISAVDFLFPDGLIGGTESFSDNLATVFVSGGSDGAVYRVTCRVTTNGGRIMDKTIRILVTDR